MITSYLLFDILVKERVNEILKQRRIASQSRVNNNEPRVKIDFSNIFRTIKAVVAPDRGDVQPQLCLPDCTPLAECQ
jgi:hypothetical protein